MSLQNKGFSQQSNKTPTSSNKSESSLYLKSANRPNSTIGNPLYLNKVHCKSTQYSIKRTRSNSLIADDMPNKILNGSPKMTASPTNVQAKFKRSDSNNVAEVNSPTKLKVEKKSISDKETLTLKQKTRSANKAGSRYPKDNNKAKEALEVSYSNLKSASKLKGKQSNTNSRKLLHEDLKDKSLLSELSVGWNKSISYGIADLETPVSTRKPVVKTELKNKKPAPILVVNCELDSKRDKDVNKSEKKEIKTTTPTHPKKSNKENSAKKASPKSELQNISIIKPVNLSESMHLQSKSAIKGKENTYLSKAKAKHDKLASPKSKAIQDKASSPKPSVTTKKSPIKETKPKQPVKPSKENFLRETTEPKSFSSLTTLPKNPLETSLDTSLLSSSFVQEIRPLTTKLQTSINSSTSFFSTKTINNSKSRALSPGSTKSALIQKENNFLSDDIVNIQPSKHSEFTFQMTYFKPIEDQRLDEYIRDVNESQHFKKKADKTMSITNEKSYSTENPPETFCIPMPSSQALETQRKGLSEISQQNTNTQSNSEIQQQTHHKKSFSTVKKTPSCQMKNPNNLALKSSVQELTITAQKVKDSRVRGGRLSLEEISKDFNKPRSPLSKGKTSLTPNEKPLVKDENIKIESKSIKNNFSKLDRILQEMKENPSKIINDENLAPYVGESEGGLFNQVSRMENSSSSTNCSLNKSFANTLRKITISHSEY